MMDGRKTWMVVTDYASNMRTMFSPMDSTRFDAKFENVADIKEIPLPSASQWIPCSERLPEEDGQYLITVKYIHVDGYEDIYAEHGNWTDGKWDMFCFGHCGEVENILAWMPLPEPYKGETE